MERIEAFLGIPQKDIGRMGQGRAKEGKGVTVAMIQSLGKQLEKVENNKLACTFGTVIIDECHHIPAKTFRQTISKLRRSRNTNGQGSSSGKPVSMYLSTRKPTR